MGGHRHSDRSRRTETHPGGLLPGGVAWLFPGPLQASCRHWPPDSPALPLDRRLSTHAHRHTRRPLTQHLTHPPSHTKHTRHHTHKQWRPCHPHPCSRLQPLMAVPTALPLLRASGPMAPVARGGLSLCLPGQGVYGQGAKPPGQSQGKSHQRGPHSSLPDPSPTENSAVITGVSHREFCHHPAQDASSPSTHWLPSPSPSEPSPPCTAGVLPQTLPLSLQLASNTP